MSKRQSQDFEGGRARESVLFIIFLFYSWRLPLTNHKNSVFLISDWCEKSMLHFWPMRCERMSGRGMCVCVQGYGQVFLLIKTDVQGVSWWCCVRIRSFHCCGWSSITGELRSHKPHGMAKNKGEGDVQRIWSLLFPIFSCEAVNGGSHQATRRGQV